MDSPNFSLQRLYPLTPSELKSSAGQEQAEMLCKNSQQPSPFVFVNLGNDIHNAQVPQQFSMYGQTPIHFEHSIATHQYTPLESSGFEKSSTIPNPCNALPCPSLPCPNIIPKKISCCCWCLIIVIAMIALIYFVGKMATCGTGRAEVEGLFQTTVEFNNYDYVPVIVGRIEHGDISVIMNPSIHKMSFLVTKKTSSLIEFESFDIRTVGEATKSIIFQQMENARTFAFCSHESEDLFMNVQIQIPFSWNYIPSLDLFTADGSITVSGLPYVPSINVTTKNGPIFITDVYVDSFDAYTNAGDLALTKMEFKSLNLVSSNGHIILNNLEADPESTFTAITQSGDITSNTAIAIATPLNSFMNVSVSTTKGNINLQLENFIGDFEADSNTNDVIVEGVNVDFWELRTHYVVGSVGNQEQEERSRMTANTIEGKINLKFL